MKARFKLHFVFVFDSPLSLEGGTEADATVGGMLLWVLSKLVLLKKVAAEAVGL